MKRALLFCENKSKNPVMQCMLCTCVHNRKLATELMLAALQLVPASAAQLAITVLKE
jgi:hypothetical protein